MFVFLDVALLLFFSAEALFSPCGPKVYGGTVFLGQSDPIFIPLVFPVFVIYTSFLFSLSALSFFATALSSSVCF